MNTATDIYNDIAQRTGGDVYIGVVGPVRTGKSSFIKRFMEELVIPKIDNIYVKERTRDELPQSGSGRTIMTAEPKFIPEEAIEITFPGNTQCRVRLVDCVGFMVDGAVGQTEEGNERMVMTPWYDHEIPMSQAAEEGTKRVISEHSSVGLLVTTDGTVCGIPRGEYEQAELRTVQELKAIGKPFIILLNCVSPGSESAKLLAQELSEKYAALCLPVNCLELDEGAITLIMQNLLCEFPVNKFCIRLPSWTEALDTENEIKNSIFSSLIQAVERIDTMRNVDELFSELAENEAVSNAELIKIELGTGKVELRVSVYQNLYYQTISKESGFDIKDDGELMQILRSLSSLKSEYERVQQALSDVREKGYGIVMPAAEDMCLEEPEIVRQGSRYGVKLKASAPSIHMIMTNIETEVSPALGGENASEEIMGLLLQGFDGDISRIWESNIFGKSLYDIAGESVTAKVQSLAPATRSKLQQTLQRIINEGGNGLICIII